MKPAGEPLVDLSFRAPRGGDPESGRGFSGFLPDSGLRRNDGG